MTFSSSFFISSELSIRSWREGVADIRLSRPQVRNALNSILLKQLRNFLKTLPTSYPFLRGLILSAEGSVFCAGMDLREGGSRTEWATLLLETWQAMEECPLPIHAILEGPVLGGGVGLVGACDAGVGVEGSFFQLLETRRGAVPVCVVNFLEPKWGRGGLQALALTGLPLAAQGALERGWLQGVTKTSQEAWDFLEKKWHPALLASSPEAIRETKALFRPRRSPTWISETVQHFVHCHEMPAAKAGFQAFSDNRLPPWDPSNRQR